MIEFAGPLDRGRLGDLLASRGADPDAYSLTGGHPSDRYVLDDRGHEWVVYYPERGLESGLQSFPSEDLACRYLADLLTLERGLIAVRRRHLDCYAPASQNSLSRRSMRFCATRARRCTWKSPGV